MITIQTKNTMRTYPIVNGKKHGLEYKYKKENLVEIKPYENGKVHGVLQKFADGKLVVHDAYKRGKRHGWSHRILDGKVVGSFLYECGQLRSTTPQMLKTIDLMTKPWATGIKFGVNVYRERMEERRMSMLT